MLMPLLVLAACLPRFEQPDIRLQAVRLGGLSLSGGTLHASLVVTNPNTYELRTDAMSFQLELRTPASSSGGWIHLADGALDREFNVLANDSASLEVPVQFTWSGVSSAVQSALRSGAVDYRLTGDLHVTGPIRRSVPFRMTGNVNLTDAH